MRQTVEEEAQRLCTGPGMRNGFKWVLYYGDGTRANMITELLMLASEVLYDEDNIIDAEFEVVA